MENKSLKRYLTQLRRALTCPRADRERLLAQGRQLVEDFEEENPGSPYAALTAAFGPPKDFAAEMLSQLPQDVVEKARKRRKYIRRAVAAVIALAMISCTVYWAVKWSKAQEVLRGDFYVVETVIPETNEEFEEAVNHIRRGD